MYSNSKIYKITDVGYNECYFGSTVQPLNKRIGQHRSDYALYKEGRRRFVSSYSLFDKYGLENCKIELVETYECKTKDELIQREGYYIRNNECVNKLIPGRTHKEYNQDNQDKIKDQRKEYREQNQEKIKEYDKEYRQQNQDKLKKQKKEYDNKRVNCDICNKEMNKSSLSKHKKTHNK